MHHACRELDWAHIALEPQREVGRRTVERTAQFALSVELNAVPYPPAPPYAVAVQPGEMWYWQCWYRDTGAPGTSNFTDAVRVIFRC